MHYLDEFLNPNIPVSIANLSIIGYGIKVRVSHVDSGSDLLEAKH